MVNESLDSRGRSLTLLHVMLHFCGLNRHTLVVALCAVALMGVVSVLASILLPHAAGLVAQAQQAGPPTPAQTTPAAPKPEFTGPPAVAEVLQSGTLIVISKASQQMHVFQDGELWQSSPVSTGRRGHSTPSGVFPILQKAVHHRSTTYSGAPMPYMQRLTWGGIAIHAGYLPGYPASHGCIRVPRTFAQALYGLTRPSRTTVVVTSQPLASADHARSLALAIPIRPAPVPGSAPTALAQAVPSGRPRIAAEPVAAQPAAQSSVARPVAFPRYVQSAGPLQTIQLAASDSAFEAEAHWARLVADRPELAGLQKTVIPAVVGSRRVYRLRASAPGAYAVCAGLKSTGVDCFNVI